MNDCTVLEAKPLLTVAQALATIQAELVPIAGMETVDLAQAQGRVLAAALVARGNLPAAANAAVDGYAFASADLDNSDIRRWVCVGTSWAGRPYEPALRPGECVRIFTGAWLPPGADSVIMQEDVEVVDGSVRFPDPVASKRNVRAEAEDVCQGSVLSLYPKKLTAADLALFAAAGIGELPVLRRLAITFFSTGDELVPLGRQPLAAGQIYDSNRYLLAALLADPAHQVVDGGIIKDDPAALEQALLQAAQTSDVLICTGGVSVGGADYVREVLSRCGSVVFWKLAMKPGKPLAFGRIGKCWFFGLPGNPLSVAATFRCFVAPALGQLCGLAAQSPLQLTATCTTALKKSPGRQEYQCGILTQNPDGSFAVASTGVQGSHLLTSLQKANCYIVLPQACTEVAIGGQVRVEPFALLV